MIAQYWKLLRGEEAEKAIAERDQRDAAARTAVRDAVKPKHQGFEQRKQEFIEKLTQADEHEAQDAGGELELHVHIHNGPGSEITGQTTATVTRGAEPTRDAPRRDVLPASVTQRESQQVYAQKTQPWAIEGAGEGQISSLRRLNDAMRKRYKDGGYHTGVRTDAEHERNDFGATTGGYQDGLGETIGSAIESTAENIEAHRDQETTGGPPRWSEAERAYYGGEGSGRELGERVPSGGPNVRRYGSSGEGDPYGTTFVDENGNDPTPTRYSPTPKGDVNWPIENWYAKGEPIDEPQQLQYRGGPVAKSGPAPLVGNRPELPNAGIATTGTGNQQMRQQRGGDPDTFDPDGETGADYPMHSTVEGQGRDQAGLRRWNNANRAKWGQNPIVGRLPHVQMPQGLGEAHDRRIHPRLLP